MANALEELTRESQFMGVYVKQTAASADNFSVADRMAYGFFDAKGEARTMGRYRGRWALGALSDDARQWIEDNKNVQRATARRVNIMTTAQAAEVAGALADAFANVDILGPAGQQ